MLQVCCSIMWCVCSVSHDSSRSCVAAVLQLCCSVLIVCLMIRDLFCVVGLLQCVAVRSSVSRDSCVVGVLQLCCSYVAVCCSV